MENWGDQAALEAGECSGGVVLFGTPAEEQQGGKIELLNRHAFADIDVALMAHPSPGMSLYPGMLAREMLEVTYHGVNSHAASNPWQVRIWVSFSVTFCHFLTDFGPIFWTHCSAGRERSRRHNSGLHERRDDAPADEARVASPRRDHRWRHRA